MLHLPLNGKVILYLGAQMYWRTDQDHGLRHNPFSALIAPRPIGWISTYNAEGLPNLAPYSFFNAVSFAPPQVMFSVGPRPQREDIHAKDSLANVKRTGCFVANLVTFDLREPMNVTSAECPSSIDEFVLAGLTMEKAHLVNAPRVEESPVHFECELVSTIPTKSNKGQDPYVIVLGEVIGVNIDESVITEGMVDYSKTRPIARMGYRSDYSDTTTLFDMPRPEWPMRKKPND